MNSNKSFWINVLAIFALFVQILTVWSHDRVRAVRIDLSAVEARHAGSRPSSNVCAMGPYGIQRAGPEERPEAGILDYRALGGDRERMKAT